MSEITEYLLLKRGLYYAPNNMGYTAIKEQAGRYYESDANSEGVTAIHEDDAPMFAPAAFEDVKINHLLSKIDALEEKLAVDMTSKILSWTATIFLIVATTIRALDYSHTIDLIFTLLGCGAWAIEAYRMKNIPLISVNAYSVLVIILGLLFVI